MKNYIEVDSVIYALYSEYVSRTGLILPKDYVLQKGDRAADTYDELARAFTLECSICNTQHMYLHTGKYALRCACGVLINVEIKNG